MEPKIKLFVSRYQQLKFFLVTVSHEALMLKPILVKVKVS